MSRAQQLTLAVFVSCFGLMLVAVALIAQKPHPTPRVVDVVALEMCGELAREYTQELGGRPKLSNPILVPSRVDESLGSGDYRISQIGKSTYLNGSTRIINFSADISSNGLVLASVGSADNNGRVSFVSGARYRVRISDSNRVTLSASHLKAE